MDTIKEITIKEINCAYETLERVLGMGGMENVKEVLWQNFSGQAAGAAMTGAEIARKLGMTITTKEIYDHYNNVVAPKFEKLYKKLVGLEEALPQEEE